MDRRFLLFMFLAVAVLAANQIIMTLIFPPQPPPAKVAKLDAQPGEAKKADPAKRPPAKDEEAKAEPAPATGAPPVAADDAPAEKPKDAAQPPLAPPVEPRRVSLGSGDPGSHFRMLVYLTNVGAAIERLEMNDPKYRDLDNRSGYLGYLAPIDAPRRGGARVRVVAPGTPAAAAGIEAGDVITAVDNQRIARAADLATVLAETKPDQTVEVTILRDGKPGKLTAVLAWEPLSVIRPELDTRPVNVVMPGNHDPLSFLMTLEQFDDRRLADGAAELKDLDMRSGAWEIVSADQSHAQFRKELPALGLEVTKTYRLQEVPAAQQNDSNYPAYSLMLDVAIKNVGDAAHTIAYRLDGPTGLPTEGYWYAIKVSQSSWGAAGLRDVVARFEGGATTMVTCPTIADEDYNERWSNAPLDFIAVDAQYFAVALIPQKPDPNDIWLAEVRPIRVGAVPKDKALVKMTDVSFRLVTELAELAPGGPPLERQFQIFAGPKKPDLLAEYAAPGTRVTLGDLVYYGWFTIVARPMVLVLHFFHSLVGNYGLAIIMLTVLVRGCMFPLSRKQALGAQKMQELQPELKKIHEKYKNDAEKKMRGQQQLFREHNYHPLGGCLLALVQLPIFVGLYRALSVDVALRQAPLFTENIRWASNLAAPDMFWNWTPIMPAFISQGTGFLGLGPYLNVLPLVTIVLFIWQQKMFMPPPADEQAAMQQKMMQYMMIFMGFLFFKVASGLCVYFIASSMWGIAERKLLPKPKPVTDGTGPREAKNTPSAAAAGTTGNGAPYRKKKKQRGRK